MKYFVSWTSRDPVFQDYDPHCNVLISPANVRLNWSIEEWTTLPNELFVDSGAFSYRNGALPSCQEVLDRQLFMTLKWPSNLNLYFSHPDLLIPINTNYKEKNEIINLSIDRAKSFFKIVSKLKIPIIPIGVIHGFDDESILSTYYELLEVGYRYFALGSIGVRLSRQRELCIRIITSAINYDIKPLHLFGISWPLKNVDLPNAIESFDSSVPAKLGFFGTVLYGSPLKRYVIAPNARQIYHDKSFSFRESIPEPLACDCPVCKVDPTKLITKYSTESNQYRTIHNYFQIKWEIEKINSHGHGLSSQ
jgi:7-cyano-7-deazaguanine tRNA-ribosyltransferase